MSATIITKQLGWADYVPTWKAMQAFTMGRDANTPDQLWVVEHPPVFTLGLNGKRKYLRDLGDIPLVRTDRGGQITYHGPGQLVIYLLLDLKRLRLGVRALVSSIEEATVMFLADHGLVAHGRAQAPGVYVAQRKIAALGLRVRRGCSYHGLSLNVDMDLSPFERIHPCGYEGLKVTQLRDHLETLSWQSAADGLSRRLLNRLGYNVRVERSENGDVYTIPSHPR